jgi:Dehydrogenases with different specificities (related to short-chain alcohol dehydrogenases)
MGNVEDVASLVMFLFSEDANYITGQTLVVDGGLFMK